MTARLWIVCWGLCVVLNAGCGSSTHAYTDTGPHSDPQTPSGSTHTLEVSGALVSRLVGMWT